MALLSYRILIVTNEASEMQASVVLLKEWFTAFNDIYFAGRLPVPDFAMGMSRTWLGSLTWKFRRRIFGMEPYGYVIRVSNYYDISEADFKSVLLHEMIHLHIVSGRMKDTSPHGRLFREQMRRINADGWNIKVSAKIGSKDNNAPASRRRRMRVVMAAVITDGRCLFSVVNSRYVHIVNSIVTRAAGVRTYAWYVSDDDFFAAFPTVRTPKGRIVPRETYDRLLSVMQAVDLNLFK